MLKIIVRLHGQIVQSLELADEATVYWAGREPSCQIPLQAESGISRQHFKISFKEGQWHLEVVSRFNELKVGDIKHRELILGEGIAFGLSPYNFQIEDTAVVREAGTELKRAGTYYPSQRSGAVGEAMGDRTLTRAQEHSSQVVLLYRSPDSSEDNLQILSGESFLVGRDNVCDLVILDTRVSRRQFKIVQSKQQFFLYDFQGANGTYLNKNKISSKDPILLASGDQIVVLNHKFRFEIRDPDYENKIQQVQHLALVEPVAPSDLVGSSSENSPNLPSLPSSYEEMALMSAPETPHSFAQITLADSSFATPPAEPVALPQEKELNFWGLRIPLNKKNIFRLTLVGVVLLAAIISANDNSADFDASAEVSARPADPISKLNPEEQKQVKVQYELAKDLYNRGDFLQAKDELGKVHAKIPSYLDSRELERFIEVGIESAQAQQRQERLQREAAEIEERIQNITAVCRQQIQMDTTPEQLDECLKDVIPLNPEHELIVKVRQDVEKMNEQRKREEAERLQREEQIAQLKLAYKQAKDVGEKDPRKGISALEEFLKLGMPDPDKLQDKARADIKVLRKKISAKVNAAIGAVQGLVEEGKHKEAIIDLEKAREVSPEDESLKIEIDRITSELRKKMQILYQEAILEENIGNIDTAKERWRKILEQDIPNGEYFAKAKIKLNKYGGL